MQHWDSCFEKFISLLKVRGLSDAVVKSHIWELQKLGNWLKRRRPKVRLEDVDSSVLITYVKQRTRFRGKALIVHILYILRGLGNFLVQEKIWIKNPLRWIKGPKLEPRAKVPRRISPEVLEGLIKQAGKSHVHYFKYLWTAILTVLYSTGLRRGELERLDLSDWNTGESTLLIDGRKTGVERKVPLGEMAWKCIEAYLPYRQKILEKNEFPHEPALFVSKHGERMKGNRIGCGIHKLARRAGTPLVTLHQFRHTCASDLLESGVKLPLVQKFLGHACFDSTMRYLAISDPERRKAMSLHPINEILIASGGLS